MRAASKPAGSPRQDGVNGPGEYSQRPALLPNDDGMECWTTLLEVFFR